MPDDNPKRDVFQVRLSAKDKDAVRTVLDFHNLNASGAFRLLFGAEARRIKAGAIATEPKARRPRADNPDKIPG